MVGRNDLSLEIASAWKRFTSEVDIEEGVTRPEIITSWKHCYKAGVDPFGTVNHLFLNQYEFKKLLDEKRDLLNITRKVISNLYYVVAGSGFLFMLSDERGFILDVIGDSDALENASKYNLIEGAGWAEEKVGTNGIGTALQMKKPIQVSGAEHYCQQNHFWTCSASPIFDSRGQITGVLQISGPSFKNHTHTLGLVVAAVELISDQMRIQQTNRELTLLHNRMNNIFLNVSDGIIVTDEAGRVVQVNPKAENILFKNEQEMRGSSVTKFIDKSNVIEEMLYTGESYNDYVLNITTIKDSIHCLSSGKVIRDDYNNIKGGLIFIKPLSKTKKLTNSHGGHADFGFEDIVGENHQFKKIIELGKIAAGSISHVLLEGESGTGKEVFAQAIHNRSSRRRGPFVAINCGAIPKELIGSELFGYDGGSFTGAKHGGKPGKFELASGGTLFLDEIGDMPLEHQVALLRVLQDQQITRVGGDKTIDVDARIICATNKNLRLEVTKGNFREDLYYRLNVISIKLPSLHERQEDIPLLLDVFLKSTCRKLGISIPYIEPSVIHCFKKYHWPGNVRELQNVVERMLNLANGKVVSLEHLPEEMVSPEQVELSLKDASLQTMRENTFEKQKIKELLDNCECQELTNMLIAARGNLSQVARELDISRNTLYKKLRRLNISVK
jgi:PAS domain S-box-containing protein